MTAEPHRDERQSAPAQDGRLEKDTAEREAARILEQIAKARNLPILRSVKVDVVDKPGIRSFAKRSMYETTTPERIQLMGRIEASMGVMPRGVDPEEIMLDLIETGVAGFYDPKQKTLFIGDFVDQGTLSMVVGHEIAHGLQDMHFDLNKHQQPLLHQSDAESARRYLIEGGAQATYLAWVSGDLGLEAIEDGVLDAMGNQVLDFAGMVSEHPILARNLQLPYADGTATVVRLVRQKGWEAVNELYATLPETSEQMLHLSKLLDREPAIPTQLDAKAVQVAVPQATVVWHDTLGEADLLVMLAEVQSSVIARRAASGWGGSHYVAFDRPDAPWAVPMVVGVVVWDTDRDATQFETVFGEYLDKMVPDYALERKGDRILFATGIPVEVEPSRLMKEAWRGVQITRPRKGRKGAKRRSRGS